MTSAYDKKTLMGAVALYANAMWPDSPGSCVQSVNEHRVYLDDYLIQELTALGDAPEVTTALALLKRLAVAATELDDSRVKQALSDLHEHYSMQEYPPPLSFLDYIAGSLSLPGGAR